MQEGLGREIIEIAIIIEFALIIVMVVATYFAKLSAFVLAKRRMKLIATLEEYFKKLIDTNSTIDIKKFKRRWKKIQILFPIFTKFDDIYANNSTWKNVRRDFLFNILVPLARRRGRSLRWLLRFYSSEVLALTYEPQDETLLLRLLRDRIPLVYLHSINTAIKSNSEAAINAVINRMAKMSLLTQTMYLAPFEHASPTIRSFIENRMKSAKETNIKAQCYKMLMKFKPATVSWDINTDLNSTDAELRLAALKFLIYINEQDALETVSKKLNDPSGEVKLVALHALGKFNAASTMKEIAQCLNDSEWRVKIAAAEVLKGFGSEGELLLNKYAPELNQISSDDEDHLPGTIW